MTRLVLTLLAVGLALPAVAQVPYSYPSPYGPIPSARSFAPNYYNRSSQPVSPYLNLLNSTSPALSYYYGVRPGTQGANGLGPVFGSGPMQLPVGAGTFLPPAVPSARDLSNVLTERPLSAIPSPGGPVTFGNVFGSSRVGVGGGVRGGFFGPPSGQSAAPTAPATGAPPTTIPPVR